MTHCIDYFRKWKREGNFCGLRKQDAKEIDAYIALVEKIAGNGAGLDADTVFTHFPAGAARPLLRCKDEKAYEYALNYVVSCLKREEDITGGDLQATINGFLGKKAPVKSTQMRTPDPDLKGTYMGHMGHSLGDQIRADEMQAADANQPKPDHFVDAKKTISPITDTTGTVSPKSDSPFKTGLQVKAGIAGEMYPDSRSQATVWPPTEPVEDPKARRNRLADELMSMYSDRFQHEARRVIQEHPTWRNGAADFFFFGGEALIDPPKKVSVEPRRGK